MADQTVNPHTFDVAVAGLGPVGELAGLLLAREGLRVLALERQADVYSRATPTGPHRLSEERK